MFLSPNSFLQILFESKSYIQAIEANLFYDLAQKSGSFLTEIHFFLPPANWNKGTYQLPSVQ